MRSAPLALLFFAVAADCYRQWRSISQKIARESDLAGFAAMIKNKRIASLHLNYHEVTVLAPENAAVDGYDGDFTDHLVLYHMGLEARTLKLLHGNNSMATAHADDPPLWITVVGGKYYVNNAQIVEGRSNYVAKSQGDQSKNQVLHVIDRVLDPMVHTPYPGAIASTFFRHHGRWKIGYCSVGEFFHKVLHHNKEDLYRKAGGHTFFIPIDHKMDDYQLENIDGYIIEGHVVPNVVLFTRPTEKNFIYETAANGDYVYIVLSMVTINDKNYVKSYTVLGNSAHKRGEVLSEIVKSDIPVSNGVIHLIKQPLAVFKRELTPFPYLPVFYKISSDPELEHTYDIVTKAGVNKVLRSTWVTFFAPRNRAWEPFLRYYAKEDLTEILKRHIVVSDSRLSLNKLAMFSGTNITLNTLAGPIAIRLNKINDTTYLVWNEKWIKVQRGDYECTDGIVHVIDDVFAFFRPPSEPQGGFWKMLKDLLT